jgi:hypothetical protein
MQDVTRNATFSSSQVYRLMTNGKAANSLGAPALKYIKQVRYEKIIGRSIQKEVEAKEMSWGNFNEPRVFRKLGTEYQYVGKQARLFHPDINHFSGIPDFLKGFDTVSDCKCMFSMEKFCDKMVALKDYEKFKDEFPEDFWQLVSNLVLLRANGLEINYIESITYVPFQSELEEIRADAAFDDSMKWLSWTKDAGLPWLKHGLTYQNITCFRFRVNEQDVTDLIERVKICVEKL